MSKKVETSIHIANGGNHSPVNYRKHKKMLLTHPYTQGLLYHIVLTGSENRKVYRKAVDALCKQLRAKGMPCRYKACYERDKFKRFHKHVFILIEAKDTHPKSIIHYKKGDWFTEMLGKLGLGFKIAPPQDPMHCVSGKQVNYAYVPKKASPKLDDCLVWISYLTKVRSKAGVEGQIYTGSTNREPKKTTQPIESKNEERIEEALRSSKASSASSSNSASPVMVSPGHSLEASSEGNCSSKAGASQAGNAKAECSYGAGRTGTYHQGIKTTSSASTLPLIDRLVRERKGRFNRVYLDEPSKLRHHPSSIGLTVFDPPFNIDPSTLLSQARSQV